MEKFEARLQGNFDDVLIKLHDTIEIDKIGESEYRSDDVRCMVRVYERFSILSGWHITLTIMLTETKDELFLSLICGGGGISLSGHQRKVLAQVTQVLEEYKAQ